MNNLVLEMGEFVPPSCKNADRTAVPGNRIEELVATILHDGEQSEIRRLTRTLRIFTDTLRNDCAVHPRFVDTFDEGIAENPHFQAMLLEIVLSYTEPQKIEEFLRLSMEYPTIFHVREAILGNDAIRSLIMERLEFMEKNGQISAVAMLQDYLRG